MAHPRLTTGDISLIVDPREVDLIFGDATFSLIEGTYCSGDTSDPLVSLFAEYGIPQSGGVSKIHSWPTGLSLDRIVKRKTGEEILIAYLDANPTSYLSDIRYISGRQKKAKERMIAVGKIYAARL